MPRQFAPLIVVSALLLAACDGGPAPEPEIADTPTAEDAVGTGGAEPLFGTWAADLRWCDGTGEGTPVTISETRFEARESQCAMTELEDNGEGGFTARLSCSAGDQISDERIVMTPIFTPTGEGIHLDWPDRNGARTTVLRCR